MNTPAVQTIRGYELRERIGAGGFGEVYLAYQPSVGREVAIKVILPQHANHPDFIRRFEAEAQLVARLEHPYIVPLYDYWREPDGAYLVMRYLRGGNLSDSLQRGPWTPEAAARLLDQIASALTVAHRQGVVHRDVKPKNILLDEEGNGYLSDFGIAKEPMRATDVTGSGELLGSPAYISPEQAKSEPLTPQSDLYSLGVVMYQVLTGEHPFSGVTPVEQLFKHLTDPLPPLRERRPDLPEPLEDVIRQATAKNPAERYPETPAFAQAFREALSDVAVEAVAPPPDWAALEMVNPYKGLRAFEEADAADFFGRDALTEQLLARLGEDGGPSADSGQGAARFLAVVGPSGSGKSSVVKAGMIPALRQGALPGSEDWLIVEMFPGAHPLEELEAALLRVAVNPPPSLIEQLQKDDHGLLRAVKRTLPPGEFDLLLVIDQFEELFTLVDHEEVRRHFMRILLAAVADPRSRVRVVVTLRADFYDRPLQYVEFGELLRTRMETVLPLSNAELERAICGPVEGVGASLDAGLAAAIIAEVNEQPGALPMLQYALTELFERREGRLLTREAYQAIGGVSGALARRAEEVYARLDAAGQDAARQLFLRLVTLGEGVEDTRRRVMRSELTALQTSEVLDAVIESFGRSRLLLFDRDPATRVPTVEVAHEALLREWGRLSGWLDESRADVRMQRLLATAAGEWIEADRDPSFLLRGTRLAQFEGWAAGSAVALTQDERAFLDASLEDRRQREAEREAQRRRLTLAAIGAAAVFLILAIVGGVGWRQAEQRREEVEVQRQIALSRLSRQLASHSVDQLDAGNYDVGLLLAIEAGRAADTAEASSVLHRVFTHLGRPRVTLSGHADRIWWGGWSRDGGRILTASDDGTARVWNVVTGAELLTLSGHTAGVRQAVWNGDGSRILTASDDGTARVWDAKTGAELVILTGHTKSVNHAVWNSDESRILTASRDATARVWDAATGAKLLTLSGHTKSVNQAVWDPDESRILTASSDGTARVWDAETGAELLTLSGHVRAVLHAVWNSDGSRILTASQDGTVRVWDAATGAKLVTLPGYTGAIRQASWNGDESRILTAGSDGAVRVWDARAGRILITLSGHADEVWQAAWNADESRILTASEDGTARVWDAETGAELLILSGQAGGVAGAAWDEDDGRILTVSADGTARVWDAATGTELATLSGHTNWVWQAVWNADESRILTSSWDGTARVWDAATGAELLTLSHVNAVSQTMPAPPPPPPASVVWNSDQSRILTASRDDTARVWDAETGTELLTLSGHTGLVLQAAWNGDESRILTWGEDGTARVWDAETGAELLTLSGHTPEIDWAVWNADGSRILTAGCDRVDSDGGCVESTARVWDAETGAELLTLSGHTGSVLQAAWNGDESRILTRSDDRTARVWDAETGAALVTLSGHAVDVRQAVWNGDESRILTASDDATARVWDAETGAELLTLSGHTDTVFQALWNSDENRILTASRDATARVWDAETGAELFTLSGHADTVFQAVWNGNESRILTASADGTVRQWYARTEDLLEAACQRAPRNMTAEEWRQFMGDEAYRATCPNLPVPEEVIGEAPAEERKEEPGLVAGCTYNAYRLGWIMDYSDAENMLNVLFHPDSPWQHTFWDNETFRELVDQALVESDFDTRMRLWQEAEDILMTDYAAVVPIFHYARTVLVRPEIQAVFQPFGPPSIKHWRLPEGETTLRYAIDDSGLEVVVTVAAYSYLIRHQIMDALYEHDGEGRIQPAGAVSYEVSEDGLVYTIKLRENATWSDGEPVTAQHYVDGITRLLEPETEANYARLMYIVQGAEAFNTGETDDPTTLGLRAVDGYTLEITLAEAASYFDTILAFLTTYPVRLDVIEQYGDLWTEPGNFVGNGAYVLTEWAHGDLVVVEKNPDYWGADDVTIERIEFPVFPFRPTALTAYERGELDVSDRYPAEELPRILEEMPDHFRRTPYPGTYYIGLNLLRPPTDNLNFRKALASAVDKWAILDNVLEEPWRIAACGVVPPEIPGYRGCGYVGYEFDVEAAQGYLQAALNEMGIDDPADISVNLWANLGHEDVMEAVAEQWETNLGIDVTFSSIAWAAYRDTLESCSDLHGSGE